MKMKVCAALILAIAVVSASHVVAYEASRGPTELIYWDP